MRQPALVLVGLLCACSAVPPDGPADADKQAEFDGTCPASYAELVAERDGNLDVMVDEVSPLLDEYQAERARLLSLALYTLFWQRALTSRITASVNWRDVVFVVSEAGRFVCIGRCGYAANYLRRLGSDLRGTRLLVGGTFFVVTTAVVVLADVIRDGGEVVFEWLDPMPSASSLRGLGKHAYDSGRLEAGCCYDDVPADDPDAEKWRCGN